MAHFRCELRLVSVSWRMEGLHGPHHKLCQVQDLTLYGDGEGKPPPTICESLYLSSLARLVQSFGKLTCWQIQKNWILKPDFVISCRVVLEPHFGGVWVCLLTTRSLVVSIWLFWLTPIDKLFEVRDQDHSRKAASKISLPRVCALRLPEWGPKEGPLLDDPPAGCSDVGQRDDVGPFFGRISLIRTPPGGDRFSYRREIHPQLCLLRLRTSKTSQRYQLSWTCCTSHGAGKPSGAVESTRCLDMIHHDSISNIYIYVRSRTIMNNQRGDDFVHIIRIYDIDTCT